MAVPQKKAVCKAALLNLDENSVSILRDSFRQFRIQAVEVEAKDDLWLTEEKFDACALRIDTAAESVLAGLRASPLNRHMIIYGVAPANQLMRQFSKYGVNVMLNHPLERQAALKVVRATHLLVLHEFRRYVRVPVITEVQMVMDRSRYTCTSVELSGGGMSMQGKGSFKMGNVLEVSFTLPNTKPMHCSAVVSWIEPDEGTIGVRFDPGDQRRYAIKEWIEEYLEI